MRRHDAVRLAKYSLKPTSQQRSRVSSHAPQTRLRFCRSLNAVVTRFMKEKPNVSDR